MALEATLGHLLSTFWPFGAIQKKHECLMPFWKLKNRKNRTEVRQEAPSRPRDFAEEWIFENLGPWGGLARDLVLETRNKKLGKKAINKGYWKNGK